MNMKNIRLNRQLTVNDCIKIDEAIGKLKKDLLESYEAIVSGSCENGLIWKAEKYLKENK